MIQKKKFTTSTLWWLDTHILNFSCIEFQYKKQTNIFHLKISNIFFFFFFLINKKNFNTLFFYNLDITTISTILTKIYYTSTQTIFNDYKLLISTNYNNVLPSISHIYSGNSWLERELKEFHTVNYINLNDSRKLLSNYTYHTDQQYNHYNNIINDIQI